LIDGWHPFLLLERKTDTMNPTDFLAREIQPGHLIARPQASPPETV